MVAIKKVSVKSSLVKPKTASKTSSKKVSVKPKPKTSSKKVSVKTASKTASKKVSVKPKLKTASKKVSVKSSSVKTASKKVSVKKENFLDYIKRNKNKFIVSGIATGIAAGLGAHFLKSQTQNLKNTTKNTFNEVLKNEENLKNIKETAVSVATDVIEKSIGNDNNIKGIEKLIENVSSNKEIQAELKNIVQQNINNPDNQLAIAKFAQIYTNLMISQTQTYIANTASNTLNAVANLPQMVINLPLSLVAVPNLAETVEETAINNAIKQISIDDPKKINDAERYLLSKGKLTENCNKFVYPIPEKIVGSYDECSQQKQTNKTIIDFLLSDNKEELSKFLNDELISKIEKELINKKEIKPECTRFNKPAQVSIAGWAFGYTNAECSQEELKKANDLIHAEFNKRKPN
jgi:hypothetical protein